MAAQVPIKKACMGVDCPNEPPWSKDGDPKYKLFQRNKISILDKAGQDAMRKVCRLSREVLDAVAREVRPGVTTDYLDEVCHNACIERN
ncbi:MAG: hypothetical protein Q9177_003799, partial [Variospora cf. flavescens]